MHLPHISLKLGQIFIIIVFTCQFNSISKLAVEHRDCCTTEPISFPLHPDLVFHSIWVRPHLISIEYRHCLIQFYYSGYLDSFIQCSSNSSTSTTRFCCFSFVCISLKREMWQPRNLNLFTLYAYLRKQFFILIYYLRFRKLWYQFSYIQLFI